MGTGCWSISQTFVTVTEAQQSQQKEISDDEPNRATASNPTGEGRDPVGEDGEYTSTSKAF